MIIKPITEYSARRKYQKKERLKKGERWSSYEGMGIYAISEKMCGYTKIGRSANLVSRLPTYFVASPFDISIEGVAFFDAADVLPPLEKLLHKSLRAAGLWVKGEWYDVSQSMLREAFLSSCLDLGVTPSRQIGVFLPPETQGRAEVDKDFVDVISLGMTKRRARVVRPSL